MRRGTGARRDGPKASDHGIGTRRSDVWGGPLLFGTVLIVLGAVALVLAGLASLSSILAFGVLLVAGGVAEVVFAFRARKEGLFLLP